MNGYPCLFLRLVGKKYQEIIYCEVPSTVSRRWGYKKKKFVFGVLNEAFVRIML